ncbi:unnamed protein product [Phaedon cochleariae]|uniref:Uncharacterized protein n=1 Tax=Phaedon cochleariae TaxID=80249 RepID=A0A9N9X410_PHACE|nr:unnamed protein product [Phaedon cochleariae]
MEHHRLKLQLLHEKVILLYLKDPVALAKALATQAVNFSAVDEGSAITPPKNFLSKLPLPVLVYSLTFIDMPELLTYMRQNYIRWKELDEQGHTTLADIQKLQSTVLMSPMFPPKPSSKSD